MRSERTRISGWTGVGSIFFPCFSPFFSVKGRGHKYLGGIIMRAFLLYTASVRPFIYEAFFFFAAQGRAEHSSPWQVGGQELLKLYLLPSIEVTINNSRHIVTYGRNQIHAGKT
ncbi:hypothetical protein F4820DRAFT_315619 [Hypoxylon rubiginosum]|uniref:Uncharacterized protein n=1 Tax=Hypoxylon rubiginosum TaxID=110542 RepID=A0ACB9YZT6_9PEZI|nr:hypothetical protein F4820DRAFT_315619 [Hypoxylon rubiginosum]